MILPKHRGRRGLSWKAVLFRRGCIPAWWKALVTTLSVLIWGTGAYGLHVYRSGNFHTVTSGLAYRSAQLSAEDLEARIKEHGIKTILNLREYNSTMGWYRQEKAVASMYDVEHHDFVLSEYVELSPQVLDRLSALLEACPKPILIHCAGGADRTALVSALFRYQLERVAAQACEGEFSARYGHVPLLRPRVKAMEDSFWRYVALRPQGATQTSGRLSAQVAIADTHSR